ncbi:hypothetical protein EDD18DRAFT_1114219 [Armillaria luteobubalina]|uniref:Uncharacterized protein n=1 Tax=Armillaria luteobubalina TaxID=153913 RepID=A0AA39P5R5_9AGAR|nr:hypothetical protein EDD18DRAFT_1114219 [Armillaria luteobubalina]
MVPQKLVRRKKHTPVVATVPVVRCSHNATAASFVLEEDSPLHPRRSIVQGHKQGEQARAPKRKLNGMAQGLAEFEQAPAWKRLSNTPVRETPLFIPDEEDIKEDILEYPYSPAMFTPGRQPSPSPVFIPASILTSPVKPGAKIP